MELRHIRYFIAVAEEMNFSKAAEKLCMAQPPLSRQIMDLEDELGVKLFNRNKHILSLTDEGILFRQYALQVLDLVNHSTSSIKELRQGLHGMLSIGTVEGNAPRLLAGWISKFHKDNPNVQYNLWNGNSDDVACRVMNGLCEIAIIMEPHNGVGLNSIPLYTEKWVAMIPSNHPILTNGSVKITMSQIADYDLIIPSRESRLSEICEWFRVANKSPKVICKVAHAILAYEFVRQNLGIAIFPESIRDILKNDDVVIREFEPPAPDVSYILVWAKNKTLSHAAEKFIEYVKNEDL